MKTGQASGILDGSFGKETVSHSGSGYALAVILVSAAAVLRWILPQLLDD